MEGYTCSSAMLYQSCAGGNCFPVCWRKSVSLTRLFLATVSKSAAASVYWMCHLGDSCGVFCWINKIILQRLLRVSPAFNTGNVFFLASQNSTFEFISHLKTTKKTCRELLYQLDCGLHVGLFANPVQNSYVSKSRDHAKGHEVKWEMCEKLLVWNN